MIRISDIKMGLDDTESDLRKKVFKLLGVKNVKSFKISKKSIDARKKPDIYYVYSVDVETDNEKEIAKRVKKAAVIEKKSYDFPKGQAIEKSIVIVGTGPAGLMCGLTLAQNGYKVILLERGRCVEERMEDVRKFWESGELNEHSNVQFGEGGAGTFSDGKLTTGIKDFRIQKVLEEFYAHGAPKEILYYSKPHVGTDNLSEMVASIRREIIRLGGEVRFESKLVNIKTAHSRVYSVMVEDHDGTYEIDTDNVVLAIGHSARDTFEMLKNIGVNMEAKSFSVGARIEHTQKMISESSYGRQYKRLPAADYKLSVHLDNGRGVYTFCMCPGGSVVASASESAGVVTNGMSKFARDGQNANSALLVNVTPDDFASDDPLAGMYFQRELEQKAFELGGGNYKAPCQYVGDFLGMKGSGAQTVEPTYRPGVTWTDLDLLFPKFVTDSLREAIVKLDNKLKGFAYPGAVLTAPETRSSSPVRIIRDRKTMQSNIKGVYPCGEGAGYAGGIMSAAVDGIKIAEMVAINNNKH